MVVVDETVKLKDETESEALGLARFGRFSRYTSWAYISTSSSGIGLPQVNRPEKSDRRSLSRTIKTWAVLAVFLGFDGRRRAFEVVQRGSSRKGIKSTPVAM
jgi:hypothetical protein